MRIRYRLRSLMLVVALIGTLAGLCAQRIFLYREKENSVQRLNDLLAEVAAVSYALTRTESHSAVWWEPVESPSWSEWITGRFPSLDVVVIGIGPSDDSDQQQRSIEEVFQYLRNFPAVTEAELGMSRVTDSDICILASSCPSISRLDVDDTQLTDASLPCIAKFRTLKRLEAPYTQITGVGFRQIGNSCAELEHVDVSHSRLTDKGLAEIATCASLRELNISHNKLSPSGLRVLASADMRHLRQLSLTGISRDYTEEEMEQLRQVIKLINSRFPELVVLH